MRTPDHMRRITGLAVCCAVIAVSLRASAEDWGARRDPFDPVVVHRYEEILARDPHDVDALRKLLDLYQRYRTIAGLEAEYRTRLAGREDWATLVVLARLPRSSRTESLALWRRVLAANPGDALGWIASGDAMLDDPAGARDAYRRAAQLVRAPQAKRSALTRLIAAARRADDASAVDEAYAQLIELSPKDGVLWLDRGNAQLAAKRFAAASESFASAVSNLRTDPERQLTAMTHHAIALEGLDRSDDAIAEYEATLDKVPSGYPLGQELVLRIVEVERRRGRLSAAIARLEKRWPERARAYLEWSTLGDLYAEVHDDERAIDTYRRALATAPTEVTTQRKLIALLDKDHPADALAQHEAAARVAPGDADLQVELAKRYHAAQPDKALAVLRALARRMDKNVGVRIRIAAIYEQWQELDRAIGEYEAIAATEPNDPDHAIVLGDAYWRADNHDKALAAWQRLDKIGTPAATYRHGEVLAMHELWEEAIAAYTKSLALDSTNTDAWYGRARANGTLERLPAAIEDARRAVALAASTSQTNGAPPRDLLVRLLGRAYEAGDRASLDNALSQWRFAFDRGDAAAGYLLAAHHAHLDSFQLHDVLVRLHRLVPSDDSVALALARSYAHRRDYARARRELEDIAHHSPARAGDIAKLVAELEVTSELVETIGSDDGGLTPKAAAAANRDLAARNRGGFLFDVGGDVRGAGGALVGFGLYSTQRIGNGMTWTTRFDWTRRADAMNDLSILAFSTGAAARVVDARRFELAIGAAPRVELRYGNHAATWDRAALAGDVTLALFPRGVSASLGLRFEQLLVDSATSSALLGELAFGVQ
jgi:tetratricopeptide (TPR) repeat protein